MATPKIIADFETQLSTALAVGGTSFTLASATDDDGVALPAGLYYFTVDNGSSQKEYLAGTLSGTSVTSVLTVSRQGAETSGAVRKHRVGAPIIMTDFATYKKYMDEIATAGASDADNSTKGIVETATTAEIDADTASGSTSAELAVTPDKLVLSKYGTQLPSSDEKDALAGGGDFGTPATGNKYVTEDYQTANPNVVIETFTADGTWTKPTGALSIKVIAVGGGGAGGGTYNETASGGGGGGGGGGYSVGVFDTSELSATEAVVVGAGATGGTSTGATGGVSSFGGTVLKANGGGGGGGYNTSGTGTPGGGGSGTIEDGAVGGGGYSSGSNAASGRQAPGGGGGALASYTSGGGVNLLETKAGPSGFVAGTNATMVVACGTGGGAGTDSTNRNGAAGGVPGGGGGGAWGGGSATSSTGGAGGRGQVVVISYL